VVVLSETRCERCERSPGSSVVFRHWTIVATNSSGESRVFEPTPGLNRDLDEASARAFASDGGEVRYRCRLFPDCPPGVGGVDRLADGPLP